MFLKEQFNQRATPIPSPGVPRKTPILSRLHPATTRVAQSSQRSKKSKELDLGQLMVLEIGSHHRNEPLSVFRTSTVFRDCRLPCRNRSGAVN
ncbi:hypothetical protein SNOG_00530 [Parastagonospora nodorum SN15]|uniref:Uncharacterized protein n=1 Tax=Phaeosphaeria nodorum (strain SN15 / ATCC MYA-4574 / FGSC 10173) TaxID=321614 RepID=Q0V634_PHANO|nr:hypothetical protein SNOG_00530 [Parastagonospora nodorum SN15]EAT92025.1 hypothetical protein SNOG_00530 [Parastagonospora nodorum SN15]